MRWLVGRFGEVSGWKAQWGLGFSAETDGLRKKRKIVKRWKAAVFNEKATGVLQTPN